MAKLILINLFIWSVTVPLLSAQQDEAVRLTGMVLDQAEQPIPNATVALFSTDGTTLISGTATRPDGSFRLEEEAGTYLLRISSVSYRTLEQELELQAGEDHDLGSLILTPETAEMDELEVRAERSSVEMNFDRRSFHVGEDIVSMGGNALDVLDNVPSITTDFEGNVSLRGNEGVQILINGRPSSLLRNGTEALSTIPSSMIEEVEVITNPSSRYSAEGTAGIINIVLRNNTTLGFNGTISAHTGHPHSHEVGANLNYHVNNINWFFSSNIGYDSRPRSSNRYQFFSSTDTTYIYDQFTESTDYELEGDIRLGADIYLPADQLLTISSRVDLEGGEDEQEVFYIDYLIDEELAEEFEGVSPNRQITPDQQLSRSVRTDFEEARERDLDLSLQYENRFDGERDHRLTADLDFDVSRERESSDLVEQILSGAGQPLNERTRNREWNRDLRVDVDYERPLGDGGRLEAGYRSTFDWMDNDYLAERLVEGSWIELPEFNDSFSYHENVNALYSTLAGNFNRFTYQAGVRAEQTLIQTELSETGERNSQNYLNLFPSLFLSYSFDDRNSVQASYSRRLRRPWSRMLLPFSNYTDSRNRSSGNPELMPEFGNSYEMGYLRYWESGSLLSNVYHRHRTDVFEWINIDDPDGVRRRFPVNLSTEKAWGIEFTADQELFDNLQLMAGLNFYRSDSEGVYEGEELTSSGESFYSRMRLRWRFAEGWNLQSTFLYRGARQTTQGRRGGLSFFNAGLSRQLFNRKVTASLSIRDLFNARQMDEVLQDSNSYSVRHAEWSSRSFRLNVRYNIGGN